jgi:hypothetical protein
MFQKYENTLKKDHEKLIRINYFLKNSTISKITISGDFFIYPEESIELIENSLLNIKMTSANITAALSDCIEKNKIELLGLSIHSIAETVINAKEVL